MLSKEKIVQLLKYCAFLIFIGRAYQYLFFDAPFRAILWDDTLMPAIVEGLFKTPWSNYVTSATVDKWIQLSIKTNGLLFVIAAFSALFINTKNFKFLKFPIYIGGFLLVLLSALLMKEKFYHNAQFFEHAIQFGIPFVLLFSLKTQATPSNLSLILKILIAITFTSHGLYALGYYPIPGNFIDMTINATGFNEDTSVQILYFAGVLDLLLSILIFIPKVSRYALLYAVIWGLLTAFARTAANFNTDFIANSLHQTLYQVIYRLPHGLIPLVAYAIQNKKIIPNFKAQISKKALKPIL